MKKYILPLALLLIFENTIIYLIGVFIEMEWNWFSFEEKNTRITFLVYNLCLIYISLPFIDTFLYIFKKTKR